MLPADLQAQIDAMRIDFIKSLPDKLEEIGGLLEHYRSKADPDALRQAHFLVHRLSGSGGTFGCDDLGKGAKKLEAALLQRLDGKPPLENAGLGELDALFRELAASPIGAAKAGAAPTPPATTTAIAETISVSDEPGRLIYLVDDDAALADNLALQLSHFGYHVRQFDEPRRLPTQGDESMPVAIIMDIGFPGDELAGPHSITGALKERYAEVPLLFISARDDFQARLETVRAGGRAYFTKPVDVSAMVNALDAFAPKESPRSFRVLVVDDSESTALVHSLILRNAGMETAILTDPARIAEPLLEFAPDLILMDVYMPVCSGIELASLIRQQEAFVGIPIVFLSAESDLDKQLRAMTKGGDDFLTKPVDQSRLVSVVATRARRARILRTYMDSDGLTGLVNHSKLKERLAVEVLRSRRLAKPLCFAMIDLDHFKSVNDTHGHAAGDRVLRSLSKMLLQRLRRTDIAGRYGGEEFGVILTDVGAEQAALLLDSIRRDFGSIVHVSGANKFQVTFSCGIAEFPGFQTAEELAVAADATLYDAKHGGRNRVAVARKEAASG